MTNRKMRKKARKQLALVMSVSMIMSSVSIPALASETEEQNSNNEPSVSVEVSVSETSTDTTSDTADAGDIADAGDTAEDTDTTDEADGGQTQDTSTTVTETTDEKTGDTTTTTVTETTWSDTQDITPDTGSDDNTDDTAGETGEGGEETGAGETGEGGEGTGAGETGEGGEGTGTGETGEGGEETGTGETGEGGEGTGTGGIVEGTEGGPGVTETTDVTTEGTVTKEGSETKTENVVTDKHGTVKEESGSIAGQETTTTENVTTETTTTTGQEIEETTTDVNESSSETGKEVTEKGEWQEGAENFDKSTEGEWQDENPEVGEIKDPEGKETVGEIKDPLRDETKVELELTPVDPEGTTKEDQEKTWDDEERVYISWNDVKDSIPAAGEKEPVITYDEDGNEIERVVTTINHIVSEVSGEVVGYEIVKETTTTKVGDRVEGEVQETGETTPVTETSAPTEEDLKGVLDEESDTVGTVETTIEEIKDDNGNVIGYTVTKVKTENIHNFETGTAEGETTTTEKEPVERFELPEKPEASETTNAETGVTTITMVEDIVENGKHVGYKTVTVEQDANGKKLSESSKSVYGTTIVVNESTAIDPTTETVTTDTTRVTTSTTTIYGTTTTKEVALKKETTTTRDIVEFVENDTWELVTTAGGDAYFLYKGEMYAVVDESTLNSQILDLQVDFDKYAKEELLNPNDLRGNPDRGGAVDGGGYTGQVLDKEAGNGDYLGYGLYSNFLINDTNPDDPDARHEIRQYAIKDSNGKVNYVYCVEINSPVSAGAHYGEYKYDEKTNALYREGDVSKLTTVAQNGFWGTAEGVGSLDAVKDLLIRNGETDVAKTLTAGQALAATQAAIWKYGNTNGITADGDDLLNAEYTYVNGKPGIKEGNQVDPDDEKNITVLYDLLLELAVNNPLVRAEDTINKDSIEGATIVLDKKAGEVDGNDVYDADLSFTLAVSTSAINGDLIVQVTDANNRVVATRRLAGEIKANETYGKIYPDENGKYTISDIQLTEGINITLNLTGTQHLADGVYIYKNSGYQDFIGLSTLEKDVNLSFDMKFEVEEPAAEIRHNGSEQTTTTHGTKVDTETGSRTDSYKSTTTQTNTETTETGTEVTRVYADVTVTEVTTETQKTERDWYTDWRNVKTTDDDDDGGNGGGGPDGGGGGGTPRSGGPGGGEVLGASDLATIPDSEVPLAMGLLPATGDRTGRWGLWTMISALGMAIVALTGKKRKEEE